MPVADFLSFLSSVFMLDLKLFPAFFILSQSFTHSQG
jgi:hypothetical protein